MRTIARMAREGHVVTVEVAEDDDRVRVVVDGTTVRTYGRLTATPIRDARRYAGWVYSTTALHRLAGCGGGPHV